MAVLIQDIMLSLSGEITHRLSCVASLQWKMHDHGFARNSKRYANLATKRQTWKENHLDQGNTRRAKTHRLFIPARDELHALRLRSHAHFDDREADHAEEILDALHSRNIKWPHIFTLGWKLLSISSFIHRHNEVFEWKASNLVFESLDDDCCSVHVENVEWETLLHSTTTPRYVVSSW